MISDKTLDMTRGLRVRHTILPSHQLKLLKRDMYGFFPRKNVPVYQCYTLGTLKNLAGVVDVPLSCTMVH